jgi:hypothetical protein
MRLGKFSALLWCICCLALPGMPGHADEERYPEYRVKAAMLYYFTQYTVWPTNSFSSNTAPIVVGILGDNPFGPWLSEIDGKSVDEKGKPSRTLALVYKRPGDDLSDCHLLFVSRSEKDRVPSLIAGLKDKPVLTVSEIDKFTQSGGMVRFVLVGGNVKFEINPKAIEDSGLRISSLVGRLAITAKPDARDR